MMKFGVFTDLHYDAIPDGNRRINELLSAFKANDVNFVIEFGDLCNPIAENHSIIDKIWLKRELFDERYHYIICTHQSLSNDHMVGTRPRGIVNRDEIRTILENVNAVDKKVLLCLNGNDHGDSVKTINGICYYSLNSASYIWQGIKEIYRYTDDMHTKYPHLKNLILYKQALYIIVSVDEELNITIQGMDGQYQDITPQEIGMGNTWNGVSIEPKTSSIFIAK